MVLVLLPLSLVLIHTCRLERREECLVNLLSTIDSQAVNSVSGNQRRNPTFPNTQHIRVLGAEIRERDRVVTFPTDLDTRGVAVINEAERMVVGLLKTSQ